MDPKEQETTLDTFPRLLQSHARLRPDQDAIREKDLGIWQSWSWAEALTEIRALACGLAQLGLKRGEKIAIIGDNRPRLYWGMTAAQALGAVPVPLYQDAVADEMAYVLDNADVRIALVENQEQVDKMLEIRERCPQLEHIIYDEHRGQRSLPIIGVNTFLNPNGNEQPEIELARSTDQEKKGQIKRLREFQSAHADTSAEALERVRRAAINNENIFAELVNAVRHCSLGEITNALFEVGGQYRRNM